MSAHCNAAELRQLVERILRGKQDEDEAKTFVREIYTEAKSKGYDKTALGKLVQHIRRTEKLTDTQRASDDMFDLYLSAYENGPHTHAHARAHVREAAETRSDKGGRGEARMSAASVRTDLPASTGSGDVGETHASGPVAPDTRKSAGKPTPGADTSAQLDASGHRQATAAAHGDATPALGNADVAARGGQVSSSEPVPNSGVTAGESTGTLSAERAARLVEADAQRKASLKPLDPNSPLFAILFKARHGRDPEASDYSEAV